MLDNFMFYAKEETLLECVKESAQNHYSERVKENMVMKKADGQPYLISAGTLSNSSLFHELFGSKELQPNDLGKKPIV